MRNFCTILGKAPMHDSACCDSSPKTQALYLHGSYDIVSCRCVDENENAVSSSECSGQTTPASGLSCNTVPCVGYVWQVHTLSLQSPTLSYSLTAALCRLAHSLQSRPVSCHLLSRHAKSSFYVTCFGCMEEAKVCMENACLMETYMTVQGTNSVHQHLLTCWY